VRRSLRAVTAALLISSIVPLVQAGSTGADEVPPAYANSERRQDLVRRNWPTDGVPGTVILTAITPEVAADIATREDGDVIGSRSVLLDVEPGTEGQVVARAIARGGVVGAEPDRVRYPARVPNDPQYVSEQWAHAQTNIATAWDTTTGDADITVAVLDTGVDGDHPDLTDNLVEQVDLSSGRVRSFEVGTDNDKCNIGHGTMVSGVVGALGDNGIGIAGVAWDVSIVDVALTSAASRCGILDSAIIGGLRYVTSEREAGPVDVVNLSVGGLGDACPLALQTALDEARDAGVLVVASSGNYEQDFPGTMSIPASCTGVLSVGATGESSGIAVYSNTNDQVDLAAPGGDTSFGRGILTTVPDGGYAEVEGTSFASPYVAGVAALLRSVDPTLTPDDLESILESTATDRGAANRDPIFGWGTVDVSRAVQAATAGDPDAPDPDDDFAVEAEGSTIERVHRSGATTEAIAQAVATSEFTFAPLGAVHAVLARSDDFADALAGSSLTFGLGPLLFTRSTGSLAGVTRNELQRVLEPGSNVYLLGGTGALPASLEAEITELGLVPVRVAGANRMETSVLVAQELETMLEALGFFQPAAAIVATAFNWPDAVTAGSLGAWFGLPILVTSPDALDATVAEYLDDSDLDEVYVVGGTAAISETVRTEIREAARLTSGNTTRLAGTTRSGTAVAVAQEFERVYSEVFEAVFGLSAPPPIVAGVNVRRADGFAHVLSAASLLGVAGGVFVPIEGEGGTEIADDAQFYACRYPAVLTFVAGGEDVISEDAAQLLDDLTSGSAEAC
jgi:subtilisin family serine protease